LGTGMATGKKQTGLYKRHQRGIELFEPKNFGSFQQKEIILIKIYSYDNVKSFLCFFEKIVG
jgi:hypothetical protein